LHADDEIVARTRKQGCLRHLEITVQANEGMRNVIASMDCVELHGRAYREKRGLPSCLSIWIDSKWFMTNTVTRWKNCCDMPMKRCIA